MAKRTRKIKFNAQNEQIIVATMIKSSSQRKKLSKTLVADDFVSARHKAMFSVLSKMAKKNLTWNEDTFMQLAQEEEFDYGGYEYLSKVINAYDENTNLDHHINVLKTDKFKMILNEDIIPELQEKAENPGENLNDITKVIDKLRTRSKSASRDIRVKSAKTVNKAYLEDLDDRIKTGGNFRPTHFKWLDENLVEGFAPGKVSLWCARPGMGKSTFLVNQVMRFVTHDVKALVLPLETQVNSFIDAFVSSYCLIERNKLIKDPKSLSDTQLKKIKNCLSVIEKSKVSFNDDRSTTLQDLGAILHGGEYDVCLIDLFEKLKGINTDQKFLSEALEYVQILAQETNTHMALFHQFSRMVDHGKKKRPTLSMLKNSGKYEEVADLVVALHRDKYYDPTIEEDILEIIILKQRVGEAGISAFYEFDGSKALIGNERADKSKSWIIDI